MARLNEVEPGFSSCITLTAVLFNEVSVVGLMPFVSLWIDHRHPHCSICKTNAALSQGVVLPSTELRQPLSVTKADAYKWYKSSFPCQEKIPILNFLGMSESFIDSF